MSPILVTQTTNTEPRVTANGNDVIVCGSACTLEVSGKCSEVRIMGCGHRIKIDEATAVFISGTDNQVDVQTLGRGQISGLQNRLQWAKSSNGDEPPTVVRGTDNTVSKS